MEAELEDLDEYVDRETVVDLIQEKVSSLIGKKGKISCCSFYSSESSEDSDSDEIIEGSHRYQIREKRMFLISNEGRREQERLSEW